MFNTWKTERNNMAKYDNSISYIHPSLDYMTKDELNFCLSRFIFEVKKIKGEDNAETLYDLIIQIQLYPEQCGKYYNLLSDLFFVQIKNALDHVMKERSASGIGRNKRKADIITVEEESIMWEKSILGRDTPQRQLDTLIYLIGLNFAFRAWLEHKNLRFENKQLEHLEAEDGECLRYTEDVSKTNQGDLASRKVKPKVVFAFPNVEKPERCLIALYEEYISHCPEKRPDNCFYLRPLTKPNGHVWYASAPVGVHQLRVTVSRLCKEAGFKGLRTNHCLRASAATRLHRAGFDEQLMVSEITGHRSNAVREYKRTDNAMKHKAKETINSTVGNKM